MSWRCQNCDREYGAIDGIVDFYVPTSTDLADAITDANIRHYDSAAKEYEAPYCSGSGWPRGVCSELTTKDILGERARRRSNEIVALVANEDASVLDVGTGTGNFLGLPALQKRNTIGVDVSVGMLQLAQRKGKPVFRANNYHLPFADQTFNLVTASSVIHHMANLDAFLAEVARVLKPGGIFYSDSDPNPLVLDAKARNRLYFRVSSLIRRYLRKDFLGTFAKSGVDRTMVDFHNANDTCSSTYSMNVMLQMFRRRFGAAPEIRYHSDARTFAFGHPKGESPLSRSRRFFLWLCERKRQIIQYSEYVIFLARRS